MRLAACVLLPAAVAAAKASLASLYIYNHQPTGDNSAIVTLKADAARLVLASRLGLDQYHSIHGQDESTLQAIDRLSAHSSFVQTQDASASVALILSAVAQEELPFSDHSTHLQTIHIENPPSFLASKKLFNDLARQSGIDNLDNLDHSTSPAFRLAQDAETLAATFKAMRDQFHTLLILNVANHTTNKNTYGSYDISHQKRQYKEAPLITKLTKPTLTPDVSSNKTYNHTTPLRGILPACFTSLASCQSLTRNCTGHGSCVLTHTDKDAGDLGGKCYSCSCKADVRTNPDGTKKTTRWGGPACQKKDIVMPFWLIASFSVFMTFLVSWGIGLLYTMGSQELPSVIGAGVSGPVRK